MDLKGDLIRLSEKAYDRLHTRLDGLTDEEYRWEPAPVAWNVHPTADGHATWDFGLAPATPAPTTPATPAPGTTTPTTEPPASTTTPPTTQAPATPAPQ